MASPRLFLARTDVVSPASADCLARPPARALRWLTAALALALAVLLGTGGVAAASPGDRHAPAPSAVVDTDADLRDLSPPEHGSGRRA